MAEATVRKEIGGPNFIVKGTTQAKNCLRCLRSTGFPLFKQEVTSPVAISVLNVNDPLNELPIRHYLLGKCQLHLLVGLLILFILELLRSTLVNESSGLKYLM